MTYIKSFIAVLVLLCVPTWGWAATYYVATTGNDTTGDGSIGNPWLTMNKADSVVAAGDTVNFRGGTYGGTIAYETLTHAGTSGNPITYQSYTGETAIIDGSARAQGTGFQLLTINGSYITLKNLEIKNASNMSILVGQNADHVIIDGNTIHDGYRNGIGLYRNHFNTVSNNHIYNMYDFNAGGQNADCIDTVDDGPGTQGGNHTIINNRVHGCSDDGIDMWRAANNTITGNLSYHNGYNASGSTPAGNGSGFKLGPGGSNLVAHNIAADNRGRGFGDNTGPNNLVYNNTAISNACYHFTFLASGGVLKNNLTYPQTSPCGDVLTGATLTTNSWQLGISDPLFVQSSDPTLATYATLTASSPAINVGTAITGFAYNGSSPDVGALETLAFAICTVEDGDASTLRITLTNNVSPPLLPATGIAFGTNAFTARKATVNDVVTAATRVGDNQIYLTLTDAIVNGNAVDFSYSLTSGNVTDSSRIGALVNQRLNAITTQSCTNNVGAAAAHVFTQTVFHFVGLRGTEAAPVATPYASAPENTNIFVVPGGKVRLRIGISCTTADCPPTGFFPRYKLNAGSYTVIPDTFGADNIAFCGTSPDADIPTSGTATTQQLSGSGTFVAGALVRTSNAIPTVDIALNGRTEVEYCLAFDTDVNTATPDVYDVRVYQQDGTALGAYTVTPRVTVMPTAAGMGF